MSYLIELRTATCPETFVLANAATREDARALVHAQLAQDDDYDDVVIVAVHAIH